MGSTILIVSATKNEVAGLLKLQNNKISDNLFQLNYQSVTLDLLITGVGINAMTYHLTKYLNNNKPKFAILVGISGAYSNNLKLGELVNVEYEYFADLGIIGEDNFTDLFEMNLAEENTFPYENKALRNYTLINNKEVESLPKVKGNTVQSIRTKVLPHIRNNADVESMEGAAFFYVCLMEKLPFIQIRSISNYVSEQDKSKWEIERSITNLNLNILDILNELYTSNKQITK